MNKLIGIAIVLAIGVSGCTTVRIGPEEPVRVGNKTLLVRTGGYDANALPKYDGNVPNLIITNGQIVIDQEPVRPIPLAEGNLVLVTWALPAGSPFSFPDENGIQLVASEGNPLPADLKCATLGAEKRIYYCTYTRTRPGQWKYNIRVRDSRGKDLLRLDPFVVQM